MVALSFALIAFSIDAMLPALPQIATELSSQDPNKAQLVLSTFLLGMGIGFFFVGPISDAVGRRPVLIGGALLYAVAALLAALSNSLEVLLLSRFFMGVCAAGPRIVGLAVVRDLFKGRDMAQVVSYAVMIFTLAPAVAPAVGAAILLFSGWRSIFVAFFIFAVVLLAWVGGRLPETLTREKRAPMRLSSLISASQEVFSNPVARTSMVLQSLIIGMLFAMLTSVQQIYGEIFGRAESFPYWFAIVALVSGVGSMANAKLVTRLGMRVIISFGLAVQTCVSLLVLTLSLAVAPEQMPFALFVIWQCTVFLMIATSMGNLNAMAMEPLGHIAGLAASLMSAISTVCGVVIATPIGQMFDGTLRPISGALFVMALVSWLVMRGLNRNEATTAAAE
ncbi:MFS transporter [Epibacterium sp. SM1979]|uniref:MFS transporter n=2 Tax=Tritonibacter litoralis TaxID=2662264 RepID=A0A843YDN3_9RHOB|nr:MFS transporter [Tritonibacter litoralis]MQQ07179.1 MFS transporter [Tritonibacter litoralis]